jgi:serine/threonine-protein kinase HipA
MLQVLELLKGSDRPAEDQALFLKAQILFWLIGATDGHAKNFSLFIGPGGSSRLTPLYDVLSAQPSLDAGQIERRQMKLAMAVGNNRHYRIDGIAGRHFRQTAERGGVPPTLARAAVEEIESGAPLALARLEQALPAAFPGQIHEAVKKGLLARLPLLRLPPA